MVALQNFLHGIQSRQFDLGGIFSGNTIVSIFHVLHTVHNITIENNCTEFK